MSGAASLLQQAQTAFRRAFLEDARVLAEAALRIDPQSLDARILIAEAHRLTGRYEAAIGTLKRALARAPDEPYVHTLIADLYHQSGRADEALGHSGAALRHLIDDADAHHAHGVILSALGRDTEAMASYRKALSLAPDHALAHVELAMAHLRAGAYTSAWPHFEMRHRLQPPPDLIASAPRYEGEQVDTLLVVDEGGHGDAIWAARFLPGLKPNVKTLVFAVRPALMGVFAELDGVDRTVNGEEGVDGADAVCPLLSAASHCEDVEAFAPTRLSPDRDPARWSELMAAGEGRLRVGIIWSGNINYGNNHNRAAPLSTFLPLLEIPGVQLYSLQKGPPRDELVDANLGSLIIDTDDFDFTETAALVEALDLIVMTDTAVAHIAGSLGKPTWLLLDHNPYWYFCGTGDQTVWYPSLRLFRQSRPGDWAGVVAQVADALAGRSAARHTGPIFKID